ncbi:MAG: EI24 domain-containing protein [Crocinitomicaceae bacterium]|nr:EI24 domain-containing protein [Crocinitomicaceae bacterium]
MGLFKDISLGLRSYSAAIRFVVNHKMWPYFVIPIIVFGGIIYLGFQMEAGEKEAKAALADSNFFYMIWGWIKIAFYFVMSYLFLQLTRYVMLTALSPLLAIVSEKVEKILTGNTYKFNLKQLAKDVKRALLIASRNLIIEISIVIGLYIVIYFSFWLLGIRNLHLPYSETFRFNDLIYFLATTAVAFYFYGFSFLDYVMERRRLTIKESIKFVRKHKGVAIALGSLFVGLFHSIEIVKEFDAGIGRTIFMWVTALLAASIPIFTAIAATLSMHELLDLSSNEFAEKNTEVISQGRTNTDDVESLNG